MAMTRDGKDLPWGRDLRAELVNAVGALTTLGALGVAYALAKHDFNIMGFYGYYIIPAGAMLVGALAASGYAIAGFFTGLKMNRRLIWGVVIQLAIAYLIAQYEMFRSFVPEDSSFGFWQWFDATTRAFTFSKTGGGQFGVFGYVMRALELGGFVFGGWLIPLALQAKPYCDPCRSYQRTSTVCKLPAGPKRKTFGRPSAEEELQLQQEARQQVATIFAAAQQNDRAAFMALTKSLDVSVANRTAAVTVYIQRCPRCFDGQIHATLTTNLGTQQPTISVLAAQPLTKEQMKTINF